MNGAAVTYTARCPECNGDAKWRATLVRNEDVPHTDVPHYVIECPACDRSAT